MALILKDGFYMEDIKTKGVALNKDKMPFIKSSFKEYQINFDISGLDEMSGSKSGNSHEMMSISQLTDFVDKKEKIRKKTFKSNTKRHYQQVKAKKLIVDTLDLSKYNMRITGNFNAKNKLKILKNAKRDVTRITNRYKTFYDNNKKNNSYINKFKTEYHRRIAFSFACIVLFLVGAPLGSLIKKGGFGIPMLFAILIFVVYFFVGVLAKGMAMSGTISPMLGGWISTIIMLPFGLFLLNKAVKDKGSNFSIASKIGSLFKYFKKKNKTVNSIL
jgi:lipopolysaccharide export system permease protein